MKKIFIVDWALIPSFILSSYTGIELHLAEDGNHDLWHNWSVAHIIASIFFLVGGILHVHMHWGWYKGIASKGIGKKSKTTLILSIAFTLLVLSGIILILTVEGAGSLIGQWHYRIGLFVCVLSLLHIFSRLRLLSSSLK